MADNFNKQDTSSIFGSNNQSLNPFSALLGTTSVEEPGEIDMPRYVDPLSDENMETDIPIFNFEPESYLKMPNPKQDFFVWESSDNESYSNTFASGQTSKIWGA